VPVPEEFLEGGARAGDAAAFLDTELYRGPCHCCCAELVCTVRAALDQTTYAGLDYEDGGEGGAVMCEDEDCGGNYVTGLCEGDPHFDSGKFHNHCTACPGFGVCIRDYRNAHCHRCGDHYFAGLSGFDCPCRGRGEGRSGYGGYGDSDDEDDTDDDDDGSVDIDLERLRSGEPQDYETPVAELPVAAGRWSGRLRGIEAELRAKRQEEEGGAIVGGLRWLNGLDEPWRKVVLEYGAKQSNSLLVSSRGLPTLLSTVERASELLAGDRERLSSMLAGLSTADFFQLAEDLKALKQEYEGRINALDQRILEDRAQARVEEEEEDDDDEEEEEQGWGEDNEDPEEDEDEDED
jgi:hypothetical protein